MIETLSDKAGNDFGGNGAISKLDFIKYGATVTPAANGGDFNNDPGDNATILGSGGGGGVGAGIGGNGAPGFAYFWWYHD